MSDKGAIAQFSSNIKTYRTIIGSVVTVGYLAAYLILWYHTGSPPKGVHVYLVSLVVAVSLVGLYGEGAVKAGKEILK